MLEFYDEIEKHFAQEYPNEGCGILAIVNEKLTWFPCTNVAENPRESFEIDSNEYMKITLRGEIVGIVHSHPDGSPEPSEHDIHTCNALGLMYYIYSYPGMVLHTLGPKRRVSPLIGREYLFGVYDCFEAIRDYYSQEVGLYIPPRQLFEENWWEKGLNYFHPENVKNWNFHPVKEIQKNDLLVFSVCSSIPNHCGVYTGNNEFYHHAVNRLSCIEELGGIWRKSLTGVFRYEA